MALFRGILRIRYACRQGSLYQAKQRGAKRDAYDLPDEPNSIEPWLWHKNAKQ
jgi:hypothetical protein